MPKAVCHSFLRKLYILLPATGLGKGRARGGSGHTRSGPLCQASSGRCRSPIAHSRSLRRRSHTRDLATTLWIMPPSTRKKAAEAAHKLLSANIVLIEELAEADATIDALDAEQNALNERMAAARDAFKERYRAALGSWTDAQLADLGYRPARGGTLAPRGRRRAQIPAPAAVDSSATPTHPTSDTANESTAADTVVTQG